MGLAFNKVDVDSGAGDETNAIVDVANEVATNDPSKVVALKGDATNIVSNAG